jgi:DNA-binding GntR family transcriptional regulator
LQVANMRESIWDEHAAIAQAIAAGDAERAESLSRQHGEDASRNLARLLVSAQPASTSASHSLSPTP